MGSKQKTKVIANQIIKQNSKQELVTPKFSLQVAAHVIQEHLSKSESMVCSPVSIDALLSILALGAENSTLEQLLMLLGHGDLSELNTAARKLGAVLKGSRDDDEDGPKISFANGLWLDQRFSLKPGFKKGLKDVHKAEVRVVDFANKADQVVNEVNSWAEQETKGFIKQVLSRDNLEDNTLLVLANALYFKGNWHKYFESKNTKDGNFNLLNGDKIRVPMMNQWHELFEYQSSDSCQVLKLPYKTGENSEDKNETKAFSMYVFLPHEKNGLPNLFEEIKTNANLLINNLEFVIITRLSFPKFKFECKVALKEPMKKLGLLQPFEKTCEDFSGMTDVTEPIYVSGISQKCFVETNERGTMGAAVTWSGLVVGGARTSKPRPPPINFVADHPFMFMIMEDVSGAVLFVGTVLDPR
ncbi:serpin-Z1B-like [Silene latifolia]|uniref:serpin-Z1B-like n=1 Tax=Silene latifolia TaxID=37657 RepID=UPI003D783EEE